MTTLLLGVSGMLAGLHWSYFVLLGLAGIQLGWQVATVKLDDAANCLKRFKSNRDYGLLVLLAIVISHLIANA